MALSIDSLTERDIAKAIDHSLLRPELDDAFVEAGCRLAAMYDVASVCVRPATSGARRRSSPASDVPPWERRSAFPHGTTGTDVKVFEARQALADGATSSTWSSQIGALKSGATRTSRPTSGPWSTSRNAAGANRAR